MMDCNNSYQERNSTSNNIAEDKCEEYYKDKGDLIRFGFNEKKSNIPTSLFFKIPSHLRNIPDYVLIKSNEIVRLVEVKGFKGLIKIKIEDLLSYDYWANIPETKLILFFYDCEDQKEIIIDYFRLKQIIVFGDCKINKYWDNSKAYFEIKKQQLI